MVELLQENTLSIALRQSLWLYPVVNTLHILGIALLIGTVLPIDLRLLGWWKTIPLATVVKLLRPVASTGLILVIASGTLLFITQAHDYLQANIFLSKMGCVFVALANTFILIRSQPWKIALASNDWGRVIKLHAIASLILWITAVFLGRFIGYR